MGAPPSCFRCSQPLENPQRCRKCGAFQPPDPRRDHFATLGLPRAFAIDEGQLERRLVEFGRELHPDLAGGDAAQRTRAVLGAAQTNEAYGVLKDPYRRGEYLLQLEGGKTANEEKGVPAGFLEGMLEERMALDEAFDEGDAAVARVRQTLEAKLGGFVQQLAQQFAELAAASDRPAALARLRATLNVMAYSRSLLRDLRERVRERSER